MWRYPFSVVAMLLAGCGEPGNGSRCESRALPEDTACDAALRFAARDADELLPDQLEVDRYAERWRRIIEAEPILSARAPQTYRNRSWPRILIFTSNLAVISAWRQQHLTTGDAAFDDVIGQLPGARVDPFFHEQPDGSYYFTLVVEAIYNEDHLDAALRASASWLDDPRVSSGDDGSWSWVEPASDTAQVQFTFGWGDCFVECDGYRSLIAIVPPEGPATVYDAGGDPLPDYLHLSPNTRPQ